MLIYHFLQGNRIHNYKFAAYLPCGIREYCTKLTYLVLDIFMSYINKEYSSETQTVIIR